MRLFVMIACVNLFLLIISAYFLLMIFVYFCKNHSAILSKPERR